MPARKKKDQAALPGTQTTAELHAILWSAADKLRGSMDAAQYKDFVLGLVFLKYVSDAFAERRDQIRAELLADEMPADRVRAVPRRQGRVHRRRRLLGSRRRPLGLPRGPGQERGHRRADRQRDGRDHEDQRVPHRRAAEDLQPRQRRPAPPRRARRPDQRRPLHRPRGQEGPRRPRRGLRVLPGDVRPRRGQARRRVLHPRQRRQGPGRGPRAVLGPGLRPVLRVGRHVRPGGEVRPRPRPPPRRHRRLRPGVQRAHLAPGQDEPRHPRHQRRPVLPLGGHLLRRQAPGHQGRLHPRQPPVQHVRLGAEHRRPPLALRRPPGGQRELRLAPAHRLQARRPTARPAWSWPTARCPPGSPAKARSARPWSRRTWSRA